MAPCLQLTSRAPFLASARSVLLHSAPAPVFSSNPPGVMPALNVRPPCSPLHARAQVHCGDQSDTRHQLSSSEAEGATIRRAADGAFMEPRGCNRWQSAANPAAAETAKIGQIRCQRLPPVDGKEGVNGSSPLEGFSKLLLLSSFSSRTRRRLGAPASTERPPLAATAFCGRGIAVADLLCVTLIRRPPGVHGPFNRGGSRSETACSRLSRARWP